jgi:hypothetical protein
LLRPCCLCGFCCHLEAAAPAPEAAALGAIVPAHNAVAWEAAPPPSRQHGGCCHCRPSFLPWLCHLCCLVLPCWPADVLDDAILPCAGCLPPPGHCPVRCRSYHTTGSLDTGIPGQRLRHWEPPPLHSGYHHCPARLGRCRHYRSAASSNGAILASGLPPSASSPPAVPKALNDISHAHTCTLEGCHPCTPAAACMPWRGCYPACHCPLPKVQCLECGHPCSVKLAGAKLADSSDVPPPVAQLMPWTQPPLPPG